MSYLVTPRLVLRHWRVADRESFARLNRDPAVMEFVAGPLSAKESDKRANEIEAHFQQYSFGKWAAELRESEQFIGYVGLEVVNFNAPFMPSVPTPCVEIGWRLAREYWGRGLATEGARAAVRYAFNDLGLPAIISFTVPANLRSIRVMEKLGMTRDPRDDFDHPLLAEGHPLRRHVLYRLQREP